MTDVIPTWAAEYITEHIHPTLPVINALIIEGGASHGTLLLNTNQGAVLVRKGRFGETKHWFASLPLERYRFQCNACEEVMDFVDPDVPRDVHCPRCGDKQRLMEIKGAITLAST